MSLPVEIFILNYNGLPYLEKTLKTILSQTYSQKQVILSDDHSKDKSVEKAKVIAAEAGIPLEVRVRNPGTGNVHPHCNVCIAEATAPYIGLFHADDLYDSKIVEKQVRFLEEHPEVDVVLTAGIAIDGDDRVMWPIQPPAQIDLPILDSSQIFRQILNHGSSFLVFPSALYRKSIFERLGGFRADLKNAGDLEMWMRVLSSGAKIGYIHEPLIQYRLSLGQGSSAYDRNRFSAAEFFQVIDHYLLTSSALKGLSKEDIQAYEALRSLDLVQVGLNLLSKKGETETLYQALDRLGECDLRGFRKNFGSVDRIKIRLAECFRMSFGTSMGPHLANFLITQTDPRSGALMRTALKWKRKLRPI